MRWVCPADRTPLSAEGDALACSRCGTRWAVSDGVPHFARSPAERARRTAPQLDELLEALAGGVAGEAVAAFCRRHGCARSPFGADWKFFFSVPEGGTTLELGAGLGDDSADLAAPGGTTIAAVPSLTNARIVRRRLGQRPGRDWPVVVLSDLTRLPLPDASVQAVALEDAAAPGFGLVPRRFAAAAAEWRRVLAPGGVVFLGLANPLHRLPGAASARALVRARPRPANLNRAVKRWAAPGVAPRLGAARVSRAMARLGFRREAVHAPLPDENDAQVVIPLDDAEIVRYFLDNLVRKNSRAVRAGLAVAHGLVRLDLFRRLVPYHYLIFRARP